MKTIKHKPTTGESLKESIKATTRRADRVTLAIIKPNTGDLTRGYTFALQTKHNAPQLLGEIALAAKFNGNKHSATPVEKLAVSSMEICRVLAVGLKFCKENQFVPCKALCLYGDGATATVDHWDTVARRMSELRKSEADANAALLECATKAGAGAEYRAKVTKAAAAASAAHKAVADYEPTYDKERKAYRTANERAIAVIQSFDELRKGL